jgi:hypothetical protein
MESIEETDQFRSAFQFASETNHCIFLTGKAGTGKTTLLKYIRDNSFKQISVVAPTGVAAINAGGATIHSFFQLPFSPFVPPKDKNHVSREAGQLLASIKLNTARRNVMRQLELLIIDEISMVRCDVLDSIDVILRSVRHRHNQAFGGVQVMMVGDMYQLPPVVPEKEWSILSHHYTSPYFFDSDVMKEATPVYIELEKIYRQEEPVFIELLNKVRNNRMDDAAIGILNSRFKAFDNRDHSAIVLTTHNYIADDINAKELGKLSGTAKLYEAIVEGNFPEKSYPAESKLRLKVGARVMFLKNDPQRSVYNGKIGTVTALDSDLITVMGDGDTMTTRVSPETWDNVQYAHDKNTGTIREDVSGRFTQFPLRLAWAITIHKSQGLTFDKVVIDAAQAFAAGQVYVALSRCRSLEGIILRSRINPASFFNEASIVSFSNQRTPDEKLGPLLDKGKKEYLGNILLDLFRVTDIETQLKTLDKKFVEEKAHFINPDLGWAKPLINEVSDLGTVSLKFEKELHQILRVPQAIDHDTLDTRLQKASTYFSRKLTDVRKNLVQCPLVCESRPVSKEITELAEEVFTSLSFKIHLLGSCAAHFDLHQYTRQRHLFVLPEFTFNIYARNKKQQEKNVPNQELFLLLQELRDDICDEEGKPIFMVANRNALIDMCTYLPSDKQELMQIKGFGEVKARTVGPRFLEIINAYRDTHKLTPAIRPAITEPSRDAKPGKELSPDSKKISLDLYNGGKTIEAIATERNLTPGTIQGHLAQYIETGELQLEQLVDAGKLEEIRNLITLYPDPMSLTEFKEKCSEGISFFDLRCFRAAEKKKMNQSENESESERIVGTAMKVKSGIF